MQSSPAFSRNIGPITEAMEAAGFDRCEFLLELGCGPGEHVVALAQKWPELFFQPTDCDQRSVVSTDARARAAGLRSTRICPARLVDVTLEKWPNVEGDPPYDGVYAINVVHIMPRTAIEAFFAGCGRNLRPGGVLGLYDTWTFNKEYVGPNNERFDASLRSQGYGGVASIEACDEAALRAGLERENVAYLAANNQFVTYRKLDDGGITPALQAFAEAQVRADMLEEDPSPPDLPMGPEPFSDDEDEEEVDDDGSV